MDSREARGRPDIDVSYEWNNGQAGGKSTVAQ